MYQVRTYNALSDKGLSRFSADKYVVSEDCAAPEAFMLRSQKLHTEVVPDSLLAVARAGAGVNNIPVANYTEQGIVVWSPRSTRHSSWRSGATQDGRLRTES